MYLTQDIVDQEEDYEDEDEEVVRCKNKRVDPADGKAYSHVEFQKYYGLRADDRWAQAEDEELDEEEECPVATGGLGVPENLISSGVYSLPVYSFGSRTDDYSAHLFDAEVDQQTLVRDLLLLWIFELCCCMPSSSTAGCCCRGGGGC